jgi:ribonucleoside-triphosphate reductase (formate)
MSKNTSREFYPGMGQAVAERTILRKKSDGKWENWADVADRVAFGNSLLCKDEEEQRNEYISLKKHISQATVLMSGRHLQHGDDTEHTRNQEVMTNCATACTSFALFYLLMNGSGVGRCYDDDMMLVDWDNSATIRCVLDESHPDFDYSAHESVRDARHKYGTGKDVMWVEVEDTREGWAKALEIWENSTFEKIHKDKMLILDFSKVRPRGTPIKGMQNRPASGPVPLMNAFNKAATLKGAGLPRWMQAIYVDHYFAECVLVGGARRAARMSTKTWRDKSVLDFIAIKRPIEYYNKSISDIKEIQDQHRAAGRDKPQGFLWSSNNSITVDQEFWDLLALSKKNPKYSSTFAKHARSVFKIASAAAYGDGTGEPGFINQHKLNQNASGLDNLEKTECLHSSKYQVNEDTQLFMRRLIKAARKKPYFMIVNPCGEIPLAIWGGFCVIGDVVPFHADSLDDAEEAFRATTRALIRVNTMDSIYSKEVQRTNRIGVGITGIHEFAWKFFGYGFRDLIDEEKSRDFWMALSRFKRAVQEEARKYAEKLGVEVPHTDTTIKPAGTTSKLFGLTEGWHLAAMAWYLRWVQFSNNDPLVASYIKNGYPHRQLVKYQNTTIIGFPTSPVISNLGLGEKLVTAAEATPEEQYQWLRLGEKYWLRGVDEAGNPLEKDTGNQISYTLKYDPNRIDYRSFAKILRKEQSRVKCCSIMPQEDSSSYEYLPEQPVTKAEYEGIQAKIKRAMEEDIGAEHVQCAGGACPVHFREQLLN